MPWLSISGEGNIAWLNSILGIDFETDKGPIHVNARMSFSTKKKLNDEMAGCKFSFIFTFTTC